MKKLTEVSNYSKFNVFGWDTVKIGIIRAKFQFSVWILKNGLFKNIFYMLEDSKFVVAEM